jgi:hypothetical protein
MSTNTGPFSATSISLLTSSRTSLKSVTGIQTSRCCVISALCSRNCPTTSRSTALPSTYILSRTVLKLYSED